MLPSSSPPNYQAAPSFLNCKISEENVCIDDWSCESFAMCKFPTYSVANKFQYFYVPDFHFEDTWLKENF